MAKKDKIIFPANRLGKVKLGTQPRKKEDKLICVTKDNAVKRIKRTDAERLVKLGWKYCSKEIYKELK